MGRPERPLDDTGSPVAIFARDLRELRRGAGNPNYRELARRALFVPSVLSSAASGHRLPTLPVTLAFVAACGGDCAAWETRWRDVAGSVWQTAGARSALVQDADLAPGLSPVHWPGANGPGPVQAAVPAVSRPAQLPAGSSTFVGRSQVVATAARIIGPGRPAKLPLLITGPVGVGKTAFALRLADDMAAEFPDGQLYADLSTCGPRNQSSNGVLRGFLRALGMPAALVPDDPMQRVGLYRSLLAQRRLFVLLDNAADERQVRPLLGRAARSQVVVTSRARLLGLDGAVAIQLGVLDRAESVALLRRLAGADRVAAEPRAADAIADLCQDLPLAISIIARKIAARPEWTIGYAAALLADHDRLLDCLSVGDVSVRDRLTSACRVLAPDGRLAITGLGSVGPGWTTVTEFAAVLDVCAEKADELLDALVDAGLLHQADKTGRYRVSSLVSAFAAAAGMLTDSAHAAAPSAGQARRIGPDLGRHPAACARVAPDRRRRQGLIVRVM